MRKQFVIGGPFHHLSLFLLNLRYVVWTTYFENLKTKGTSLRTID